MGTLRRTANKSRKARKKKSKAIPVGTKSTGQIKYTTTAPKAKKKKKKPKNRGFVSTLGRTNTGGKRGQSFNKRLGA